MFFFKRGNSQKYYNRFFFIRGRCTELYGKILVKWQICPAKQMLAGLKISCIFIPATLYQLCDILLFFLSAYRFFNLVTYHLFRVFPLCTFPSLVRYSMNTIKPTTSLSYLNATGLIPYGMTNDYMFRIILEKIIMYWKGLSVLFFLLNLKKLFQLKSRILFYSMKLSTTKNLS